MQDIKFDHTIKWYVHKPEFVLKMIFIKFSGSLRYKRITNPEDKAFGEISVAKIYCQWFSCSPDVLFLIFLSYVLLF